MVYHNRFREDENIQTKALLLHFEKMVVILYIVKVRFKYFFK
jgi:hypothetical protein